jgi:thiol-disulfide isomerase/thioredoxin
VTGQRLLNRAQLKPLTVSRNFIKMNTLKIVFILFILCPTAVFCQSTEFKPRHWYQQQFIIERFILNKGRSTLNTTDRIDSLFKVVDHAWKRYVADSLQNKTTLPTAALDNLDAYSYYWAIKSINGYSYENSEIDMHVFKNYMLPSMMTDLQLVTKNPILINQNLIWAGSLDNTIALGNKFFNDRESYNSLYSIIAGLKEKLLLLSATDPNNKIYSRLLGILNESDYEIESKRYYAVDQPHLAFTYLITGMSTHKYYKPNAITFAKALVDYYTTQKETDKALAILSNLLINTSEDELSRDTLRLWHERVDAITGAKLFHLVQKKLSGKTYNVTGNKAIRFPAQWNLVNTEISEDKIKKAKFILLDFWYSGCAPCIAEIPALNKLYEKLKSREDIVFISINTDFQYRKSQAFVKETSKKFNVQFPVVYDDAKINLAKQLNVIEYPSKFILNARGQQISKGDNSKMTVEAFLDYIKPVK